MVHSPKNTSEYFEVIWNATYNHYNSIAYGDFHFALRLYIERLKDMIQVGTQILVFTKGWLIVEDIDSETGLLFCQNQDGEEIEISESQVDSVLDGGSFGNDVGQELTWR